MFKIHIYITFCFNYHIYESSCGKNKSFPNQVSFALGWAGSTLAPIRTNLLNPTSGRDVSHPYLISTWDKEGCTIVCVIIHTMVHPSLAQVLIRQEWEASLPNVGLSNLCGWEQGSSPHKCGQRVSCRAFTAIISAFS